MSTLSGGDWIISNLSVPRVDHWSWRMAQEPWQDSEYLSDAAFALTFRAFGWAGETLLIAVAMCITALIMGLSAARRLSGLALVIAIGPSAPVLMLFANARGQTLSLPLIAIWVAALLAARDENRSPSWWLLVVMLILVQGHGYFLFALMLTLPFALEAVWEAQVGQRLVVARAWAPFGVAEFAVAAINPYGIEAFAHPFRLIGMNPLLMGMSEWAP